MQKGTQGQIIIFLLHTVQFSRIYISRIQVHTIKRLLYKREHFWLWVQILYLRGPVDLKRPGSNGQHNCTLDPVVGRILVIRIHREKDPDATLMCGCGGGRALIFLILERLKYLDPVDKRLASGSRRSWN